MNRTIKALVGLFVLCGVMMTATGCLVREDRDHHDDPHWHDDHWHDDHHDHY